MKLIIDADSCPVREIAIKIAKENRIKVLIISSISQNLDGEEGISIRFVDSLPQEADIAIINSSEKEDIIVTYDLGLASIVLGKGAKVISPDGKIFTERNIEHLLESRDIKRRLRERGIKIKGPKKRKRIQDVIFEKNLKRLLEKTISF